MKVEIRGPLGCRIWQGATNPRGYPVMKVNGKTRLARRVIYEREKRPLQPGERVVMECGERQCVHSAHMHAKLTLRQSRQTSPVGDAAPPGPAQ